MQNVRCPKKTMIINPKGSTGYKYEMDATRHILKLITA